jgi:dihydroorotase-like cyclic amidohydrolase
MIEKSRASRYAFDPGSTLAGEQILGLHAFLSRRVVTSEGIRPGAVLVDGEQIRGIVAPDEVPADATREDFGDAALLPGLVDSHVHINEPGRTEWEGFRTATRAAAAGGYTMLVDMPLNCVPATTNVAALEAKRPAAQGQCRVDWGAWGGVVQGNQAEIEALAEAGVLGFKCFLVHPGIEEFTMVREADLRTALPHLARTGLPLLVHAELPGPVDAATRQLRDADWRFAANITFGCILSISPRVLLSRSFRQRGQRSWPSPWRLARTTCIWRQRQLPMEQRNTSARHRFGLAPTGSSFGWD